MIDRFLPKSKSVRGLFLLLWDICVIQISSLLALLVRFDFMAGNIPEIYLKNISAYDLAGTVLTVLIFTLCRLYSTMWGSASIREAVMIVVACLFSSAAQISGMVLLGYQMPRSYYILWLIFMVIFTGVGRFSYRTARIITNRLVIKQSCGAKKRVMIVGAGQGGALLIKELKNSDKSKAEPICIVDDDVNKTGRFVNGVPVKGTRKDIAELAEKLNIHEIYIAMPSAMPSEIKEIIEVCQQTRCTMKILPGLYQLANGDVTVAKLRKVRIEDLLGREPVQVNLDEIMGYIQGKTVLVTGGGGSIGSELCRQLAEHGVGRLIIFDMYENNAYDIQQELKRSHPELNLEVLIGSVRNTNRLDYVFRTYRPDIVYHAAAHKHVPLMEDSPNEAIKNNVIGTYKTAKAAIRYGVKRFILISTDKAVNPTNIMGASKRLCEMVIQMCNRQGDTEFAAVRFGNVLGSNGSVIPLFKKQIEEGGPVTVTHKDIIRYFMTIPEAVSLVLQAGAYGKGGEIFVLNMGEPVRILDMAEKLIKLSGYEPYEDIKIEFTGLRPGEKLYEELLMDEEGLEETKNNRIFIGQPIKMDYAQFEKELWELDEAVWKETGDIRGVVKKLVPGYHYAESERKVQNTKKMPDIVSIAVPESVQDVADAAGFCAAQEAAAGLEWKRHHRKLAEQKR